jgi:hypothetical protein
MKRISTTTRVVDKFGVGKSGFTNGNAATGIAATDLESDWFDSVQEELCSVIESSGVALDGSKFNQLATAILALIQSVGDARYARGGKLLAIGWSRAGNVLTLTCAAGTMDFPNVSLSSGAPAAGVAVPAGSIPIPAAATLGTVSGQSARLVLLEAYNGGAPVLCVANLAGGLQLDETNLISPTTVSAGATSAGIIYSASAVIANSPYRVVGFVDVPGNTGAAWAADVTNAKGGGGQSLAAMSSLGYGQAWQNLSGSRVANTVYYNTTGRPITCIVTCSASTGVDGRLYINGATYHLFGNANVQSFDAPVSFIVPPGASYGISSIAVQNWLELR